MLCVARFTVLTRIQRKGVLATGDCLKWKRGRTGTPHSFRNVQWKTEGGTKYKPVTQSISKHVEGARLGDTWWTHGRCAPVLLETPRNQTDQNTANHSFPCLTRDQLCERVLTMTQEESGPTARLLQHVDPHPNHHTEWNFTNHPSEQHQFEDLWIWLWQSVSDFGSSGKKTLKTNCLQ